MVVNNYEPELRPDGRESWKVVRILDGRYRLWLRQDGRIGWALVDWPNDGLGIQNHGAGDDEVEAYNLARAHMEASDGIRAEQ